VLRCDEREKDMIEFSYVCPFPELLAVREMALGRGAMLDKFICDSFREREVMIDDWLIILLSSGTGEGDRELYWDEVPEHPNLSSGMEYERVREVRTGFGMMCRSRPGLLVVDIEREDFDLDRLKEKNLRMGYIH